MKHTTEELLLAAEVRKIAVLRRNSLTAEMSDAEAKEFRARPMNDLIEEVLRELSGIAAVIAKARLD